MYTYHSFFNSGIIGLGIIGTIISVFVTLWIITWKGYAVYTAAKRGEKRWFVAVLILNTLSILDIYYVIKVAKIPWHQVWQTFGRVYSLSFWQKQKTEKASQPTSPAHEHTEPKQEEHKAE